jgi:hypothetical protein
MNWDLSRRSRNLLLATLVWLGCLLCWFAITAFIGGELDASVLVPSIVSGLVVSAVVSQLCTRWNKRHAAVIGLLLGIMPSAVGLFIGHFSAKGIDASIGWIVLSLWVMIPNGAGGALAGVACAQRSSST